MENNIKYVDYKEIARDLKELDGIMTKTPTIYTEEDYEFTKNEKQAILFGAVLGVVFSLLLLV